MVRSKRPPLMSTYTEWPQPSSRSGYRHLLLYIPSQGIIAQVSDTCLPTSDTVTPEPWTWTAQSTRQLRGSIHGSIKFPRCLTQCLGSFHQRPRGLVPLFRRLLDRLAVCARVSQGGTTPNHQY